MIGIPYIYIYYIITDKSSETDKSSDTILVHILKKLMTVKSVDGIINGLSIFCAFGELQSYYMASWPHILKTKHLNGTFIHLLGTKM